MFFIYVNVLFIISLILHEKGHLQELDSVALGCFACCITR